jgi:hypothetical protein
MLQRILLSSSFAVNFVPVNSTKTERTERPVAQQMKTAADVPAHIELERGPDPAIEELQAVYPPSLLQIERRPDPLELGPR